MNMLQVLTTAEQRQRRVSAIRTSLLLIFSVLGRVFVGAAAAAAAATRLSLPDSEDARENRAPSSRCFPFLYAMH